MPTLLESVLEFCDNFPIISIVVIIICIVSSVPCIILLIAIQRAAVHANCRVLISFWAFVLFVILLITAVLYGHMFTFTDGFLPRGVVHPPLRPYLLWMHGMFYFISSSLEMFIVIERILSTRQPHQYHESACAIKSIVFAIVVASALGCLNDYLLNIRGSVVRRAIGFFAHNVLDLLTSIVNIFGIRYSRNQFGALYGRASLNARYQVKEAHLMANAMHPVYLTSLCLKLSATGMAYVYAIFLCCSEVRYYVLMDLCYYMIHVVNCVFSSTFLIFKHSSIRKSALNLFRKDIEPQNDVIINGNRSTETTNAYFSMLGQSWQ